MRKMRKAEITRIVELATVQHFNYRTNIIVPNVSWGLGLRYEADLVVLRPSGFAAEVEVKASASDIKKDLEKRHGHGGRHYTLKLLFRELWFAVPEHLMFNPHIPDRAGILFTRYDHRNIGKAYVLRNPKIQKNAVKFDAKLKEKLLHLGVMRVWGLKENLIKKYK